MKTSWISALSFNCLVGLSLVACGAGGDGTGGASGSAAGASNTAGVLGASGNTTTNGAGGTLGSGGTGTTSGAAGTAGKNPEDCGQILPIIVRDFKDGGGNPDFDSGSWKGDDARSGLVEERLGADHKPVFRHSSGCPIPRTSADITVERGTVDATTGQIKCPVWGGNDVTSIKDASSFNSWYRNVDGVNVMLEKEIPLTPLASDPNTLVFDSGTSGFFPLEPSEGWADGRDADGVSRNFLFTSEAHLKFIYKPGQVFSFSGDDDLWIYVNGVIALDIGSKHAVWEGTIDFDAQAARLGISAGGQYTMDIFHAERMPTGSNFKITTNISCFEPVPDITID